MATTNIRNYTSEVPAEQSISRIEALIANFGAQNVSKAYEHGQCVRMTFTIIDPDSQMPLDIVLDPREDQVYSVLRGEGFKTDRQIQTLRQQARRTAWKNILDLLSIQLTMLRLQQRSILQSFLSETVDQRSGRPLHQIISAQRKLLPGANDAADVIDADNA